MSKVDTASSDSDFIRTATITNVTFTITNNCGPKYYFAVRSTGLLPLNGTLQFDLLPSKISYWCNLKQLIDANMITLTETNPVSTHSGNIELTAGDRPQTKSIWILNNTISCNNISILVDGNEILSGISQTHRLDSFSQECT